MEFGRELPPERAAQERVSDWREFHLHLPEEKVKQQCARCMDCGVPFCHTGLVLKGMASGCPINNLIPEWNDLVYKGLWRQALDRLLKTNNFPEFTGRVCPAPCEGACTLGITAPAVTIRTIEQTIVERGFAEGWIAPSPPAVRTGKKVAVVGSGPAGLSCADQLNKVGHWVTVLERADRVGGLLTYGIPTMKLDKDVVKRRIDLMAAEGVKFVINTEVGRNYPADKLLKGFDAVVLCAGATRPRDLQVEGRGLRGIHFAMEFLHGNAKKLLDQAHGDVQSLDAFTYPFISAEDRDVVVIGGGDTGTDCVGTALRHKCRSVVQLEILSRPPDQRRPDNPWPEWPRVHTLDYGQAEHQALYGKDPRTYSVATERFVGDDEGNVGEVQTIRVEWVGERDGRLRPGRIPGTERSYPAQLVLIAVGFLGPEETLLGALGIARDDRSNARADYRTFATSLPGVFAAGDMRRGQSLVVWAINEGRGAARECDRFLMGETSLP